MVFDFLQFLQFFRYQIYKSVYCDDHFLAFFGLPSCLAAELLKTTKLKLLVKLDTKICYKLAFGR